MNVEQLSQRTGCDLQAALRRLGGMETLYERLINILTIGHLRN